MVYVCTNIGSSFTHDFFSLSSFIHIRLMGKGKTTDITLSASSTLKKNVETSVSQHQLKRVHAKTLKPLLKERNKFFQLLFHLKFRVDLTRVIGWKRIGEDNQSSPLPSQLPKQER
ncbi:uncharacterized protein LOC123884531 [Trifolium pratense]|uniref:uncharacterized protein LOC123884531 n=1 Tax=Trifolium pratense TaxID=57577 RepID=UPI001E69745F|nr:uncharacterized protein LOC123884531 [Trifolium pratense]